MAYRNEMDMLNDFLEDRCVTDNLKETKVKDLYEGYEKWCEENGEKAMSKRMFGVKLDEKGFDMYRGSGGVRMRIGIGIKGDE
jgi:putative DNA primase/helicase